MKIMGKSTYKPLFKAAMEAPMDVTAETERTMQTMGGDNPQETPADPTRTSTATAAADGGDIDNDGALSTDTNNILDTPENETPDDAGIGEDDAMVEGDNPDDPNAMGDTGMAGDTTNDLQEQANQTNATAQQIESLKKLRDEIDALYHIIQGNIEILGSYTPNSAIKEAQDIYFKVQSHLNHCSEYLYNMLTDEFNVTKYPDLLQKYIAIRHIYDLTLNMLNMHFNILDIAEGTSQSGSKSGKH